MFTHWDECSGSQKNYSHSSWKITLANCRGDAFGKFLTPRTYIGQTQLNRTLVNGAPFSPIKFIQNIMDNAILNRQWMNSISSSRKHLDEIIRARWIRVLIELILRCWGQKESHLVYRPEKVGFLYTEVRKAVEVLCTNASKKESWWLDFFPR